MEYIDKSKNRTEGLQVTEEYLQKECVDANRNFHNIRYDTPKHPHSLEEYRNFSTLDHYKQRMVDIVMANQNRYCCYCLRKLNGAQEKTLEHIIPKTIVSADTDTWDYYQRVPELNSDTEVQPVDVIEGTPYRKGIPHPHIVAYNNFVASCDGTFPDNFSKKGNPRSECCNNKRGDAEAFPLYYLENVESLIEFTKEGRIEAKVGTPWYAETDTLITNVVLNYPSLVTIRKMWYKLRHISYVKILEGNDSADKRRGLLYLALFPDATVPYSEKDLNEALDLQEKFMKPGQWDTFMLYHKFYSIMNRLYP